jgi:hypothetical protein
MTLCYPHLQSRAEPTRFRTVLQNLRALERPKDFRDIMLGPVQAPVSTLGVLTESATTSY